MKLEACPLAVAVGGRSPQGERGLKLGVSQLGAIPDMSLPARGAWVETQALAQGRAGAVGRSPQGERGLKRMVALEVPANAVVAPRKGSVG